MKVRPLHDNIIVEFVPASDRTSGGIVLPDACKDPPARALVLDVGPGKIAGNGKRLPMPCEKGDFVLVCTGSGQTIPYAEPTEGTIVRMVTSEDIIAVEKE